MKLYAHFNTSVGDFGHQADSLLLKGCHGISDHRDSSAVQAEIINACGDLSGMHPVTAASSESGKMPSKFSFPLSGSPERNALR